MQGKATYRKAMLIKHKKWKEKEETAVISGKLVFIILYILVFLLMLLLFIGIIWSCIVRFGPRSGETRLGKYNMWGNSLFQQYYYLIIN